MESGNFESGLHFSYSNPFPQRDSSPDTVDTVLDDQVEANPHKAAFMSQKAQSHASYMKKAAEFGAKVR